MTPLYDATVVDLSFDPAAVSRVESRTDRKIAHERWWAKVSAKPTPVKRATRVSRKKAS